MKRKVLIFATAAGSVLAAGSAVSRLLELIRKYKNYEDKYYAYYLFMCQWIKLKKSHNQMADFFAHNNMKKIAIYGMESMGNALYEALAETNTKVEYAIDKNADDIFVTGCDLYKPEDDLPEVDAIVVTPFIYFREIQSVLQKKVTCPVISIEDVVYGV